MPQIGFRSILNPPSLEYSTVSLLERSLKNRLRTSVVLRLLTEQSRIELTAAALRRTGYHYQDLNTSDSQCLQLNLL